MGLLFFLILGTIQYSKTATAPERMGRTEMMRSNIFCMGVFSTCSISISCSLVNCVRRTSILLINIHSYLLINSIKIYFEETAVLLAGSFSLGRVWKIQTKVCFAIKIWLLHRKRIFAAQKPKYNTADSTLYCQIFRFQILEIWSAVLTQGVKTLCSTFLQKIKTQRHSVFSFFLRIHIFLQTILFRILFRHKDSINLISYTHGFSNSLIKAWVSLKVQLLIFI